VRTCVSDPSPPLTVNRLERLVRDASANKEYEKIRKIVEQLCHDYAYAVHQPHARNGGLIGLAAASIALGSVGDRSVAGPFADELSG
jgi:hypothetical protein